MLTYTYIHTVLIKHIKTYIHTHIVCMYSILLYLPNQRPDNTRKEKHHNSDVR